jgi:hypothetical protein
VSKISETVAGFIEKIKEKSLSEEELENIGKIVTSFPSVKTSLARRDIKI